MKKTIEFDEECQACKGTGLYVGMAERCGAAIVCYKCNGTGCFHFKHTYEDFTGLVHRNDVTRVYQTNPGICIGTNPKKDLSLEDFGGMSYAAWKSGAKFVPGTEDRNHTCPAWFYQTANDKLMPKWKECSQCVGLNFFSCSFFEIKNTCWRKWDQEFAV